MKSLKKTIILLLVIGLLTPFCGKKEKPEPVEPTPTPTPPAIKVTIADGILETLDSRRPEEVPVFEIQEGDPKLWAKKFSALTDIKEELQETEDLLFAKEGDRYFEVRKISTTGFYGDMAKLWKAEPSPEKTEFNIPGNEEAQKIAMEWLKKFGFSEEEFKNLRISITDELFELTFPDKKDQPPLRVVVGKNVEVRRTVDGLFVFGPGSKIKFFIGEKGEVQGMMAVWRQIDPGSQVLGHRKMEAKPAVRKMTTLGAKEAFEILREKPLEHIPLALVNKIHVDEVEFGYYGRSASEQQKYLQPVFVFRGKAYATIKDKEVDVPYVQYVPALKEPLESIWPKTRAFKPPERDKTTIVKPHIDEDEKGGQEGQD